MSLDAKIRRVGHTDKGLRLELEPRFDKRVGHFQPAGQPAITIVGPISKEPEPGFVGSSDSRVGGCGGMTLDIAALAVLGLL
jgi:hypothetical protein